MRPGSARAPRTAAASPCGRSRTSWPDTCATTSACCASDTASPSRRSPRMTIAYEDEEDETEPTVRCPSCRREIHEESQRCEHCGHYVTEEELSRRKPWWWMIGAIVCLYVVFRWIVR